MTGYGGWMQEYLLVDFPEWGRSVVEEVIKYDHACRVGTDFIPSGHIVDGLAEEVGFGVWHGGVENW